VERIEAPALVVHGTEDVIVPVENGRRLAARLPNAEYLELEGAGHNLSLEDPEGLAAIVLEFLDR
jgi:3-oxoadipate enol-lactonase